MSLELSAIFDSMVKQFRTQSTDDRFQSDFVFAANNALDELSFAAELSTPMDHVTGSNSTVSQLDQDDQKILSRVVAFELVLSGRKHVRGDSAYKELKVESEEAAGSFMVKKSRDDQADVADNLSGEGAQIIGLGDRTDAVSTGTDTSQSGTDTLNGE